MPASMSDVSMERPIWPVRFWRKRVRDPVLAALRYGVTPPRVALAVVLGFVSASWPQIGTNPLMGLLLAWVFRCNRAIVTGIAVVFTPLQYMFMIPFLRLGETLLGVERFETSVPEIIRIVFTDPIGSFSILGLPLVHAICGWIAAWLVAGPLLYIPALWLMRRISSTGLL